MNPEPALLVPAFLLVSPPVQACGCSTEPASPPVQDAASELKPHAAAAGAQGMVCGASKLCC